MTRGGWWIGRNTTPAVMTFERRFQANSNDERGSVLALDTKFEPYDTNEDKALWARDSVEWMLNRIKPVWFDTKKFAQSIQQEGAGTGKARGAILAYQNKRLIDTAAWLKLTNFLPVTNELLVFLDEALSFT
jgi:hypothetical protein